MKKFKYLAYVDFEFTVPSRKGQHAEILSIGAVITDDKGVVIASFNEIVKPCSVNITLSQQCTRLTGITQRQVNKARPFMQVYWDFVNFLRRYHVSDIFVWGYEDSNVLKYTVNLYNYNGVDRGLYRKLKDIQPEISKSITLDGVPIKERWNLLAALSLYTRDFKYFSLQKHEAGKDALRLSKLHKQYLSLQGIEITQEDITLVNNLKLNPINLQDYKLKQNAPA